MESDNKRFWQRVAKIYGRFMKGSDKMYDDIARRVCPYLSKEKNILELACGTGQLSYRLSYRVRLWEATDFSENMIQEAKKNNLSSRLFFSVQDATALPYAPETFDGVMIANALILCPTRMRPCRKYIGY